jgi:hypothetical protein
VLRPERLRQVPLQFSWVDQALVRRHLIDRLHAQSAALYLFLLTVADAQGLSYYGDATLAQRLGLRPQELTAARAQLMALELVAFEAPLYQVLALSGAVVSGAVVSAQADGAPETPLAPPARTACAALTRLQPPSPRHTSGPVSLGDLLAQLERRRGQL